MFAAVRLSFFIATVTCMGYFVSAELRQLDLQRNELRGPLPRSIKKLQNLLYLNIKDNEAMGGTLPLAELLTLTRLNRLSLVHCSFDNANVVVDAMKEQLPRCKVWV